MTYLDQLPDAVARSIRTRFVAEFATVSAAGTPINTPLVTFTSDDLTTIDAGTGLAYPAKAERSRRNPKTGLLFEGGPSEPVVAVAGLATVRDSDFQAHLDRYLSEQILAPYLNPQVVDYESVTRHAIHYFTRILTCVTPTHILWWDSPAAMDGSPHEWRAPADLAVPKSDPAPPGKPSEGEWKPRPWRELAEAAVGRKSLAHLTLFDSEGFPLSARVRDVTVSSEGFDMAVSRGVPWIGGKASISFEGVEIFVGEAIVDGSKVQFQVERALPVLPMMADFREVLQPGPVTRAGLMKRLHYELERRGQPLPVMPAHPPEPTAGGRLRASAADAFPGVSSAEAPRD